ncbi:AAA family ATPase [Hyalangium rubrum]|uniref:AAA family ATPase n=1 Tax=Hyalangium rubrum TaxID=3103134 RepID=A0ABU5H188_9BACT|nr:AAA family ATPase [Hyalangium sp. s54d21]MDY7226498.1 AAA family ATPase [Hyalangium sp. s54d21]
MIESVHFQNFRCLRDVKLNLAPLTVLVGPNSSGKTTVLEGLQPRQFDIADVWRQDTSLKVSVKWGYSNEKPEITTTAKPPGETSLYNSRLSLWISNWSHPHQVQSLALDLKALRGENVLAAAQQLSRAGENLTNVFATLTRQQQAAVAKELCRLVPMFSDVDLEPTANGRQRLRFQDRWDPDLWLAPSQVSDGTMLVLAFLVLQHQNPPADILTIEEPERALHPYLLEELIQLLRKMTTGEIGRKPIQVILATHSAELLEYVRPEEVRFLTRSPEDGSVQVNEAPTNSTNWQQVYKEYRESLGSIWLSGSMGGVPGR